MNKVLIFSRVALFGLFLCLVISDVAGVSPNDESNQDRKAFVKKLLQHLIMQEPNSTARESEEWELSNKNPNIPDYFHLRPGFLYKGNSTLPKKEFMRAINAASILGDKIVFQNLNLYHRALARPLFRILYEIDSKDLDKVLCFAEKHVNKYMFLHILRLSLRHRSDMSDVSIPSHITLAPYLYFEMGNLGIDKPENKILIVSGSFQEDHKNRDLEFRLSHFRLDPGFNTHHEHWHEVNLDAVGYVDGWSVDRAGEMFYYMHSQIVARYNFERLSAQVPLVEPLLNLREPIPEPYFEKLTTETREKLWDSRPPNQLLTDVNVRGFTITIQQIEVWRDRLYEAIDRGTVYKMDGTESIELLNGPPEQGQESDVPFDVGIDKLGYMVWAYANKSVNYKYYGNLHNSGHNLIGNAHDSQGLYHRQSRGSAMLSTYSSTRDPVFYRWHKFVDDIFDQYKASLPAYSIEELDFKDVQIGSIETTSCGDSNIIRTRWLRNRVNITEGIPENMKTKILQVDEVYYDFAHLSHDKFQYLIKIHNNNSKKVKGTIRIFLAPIYKDWKVEEILASLDESTRQQTLKTNPNLEASFNKYRRMFIELDKFVYTLHKGENIIKRNSINSSVTIPFERLFMTKEEAEKSEENPAKAKESLAWNGCGWPNYLLVGRGNEDGFPARIFIMVSDYQKDKAPGAKYDPDEARGSLSYCGVPNAKHPDRKPMGFPFDRNMGSENFYLHHFMSKTRDVKETPNDFDEPIPERFLNMKVVNVMVKHCPGPPVNGWTINPEFDECKLKQQCKC